MDTKLATDLLPQEKKISMFWTTKTAIFIRMIARASIQRKQPYLWFIENIHAY